VLNPAAERARYGYDTDKDSAVLRIEARDGRELGMFNWFAVHGTSMAKDNTLISGDNKGYAAALFEAWKGAEPGAPRAFVAGFDNANAGDASPNVGKDVDGDGDWECAANDNFLCAAESGAKQAAAALRLYNVA